MTDPQGGDRMRQGLPTSSPTGDDLPSGEVASPIPDPEAEPMTEPESSGYHDSPATSDPDGDLVDGTPGHDRGDGGERDVTLTTDDEAQRDDTVIRGGNEAS